MDEMKKNDRKEDGTSAADLLSKLNENLGTANKQSSQKESTISRELKDIGRQLKVKKNEEANSVNEDFLSEFFEKEINNVEIPEDGFSDFDIAKGIDDIDDDFANTLINEDGAYVADHSGDGKTKVAQFGDDEDRFFSGSDMPRTDNEVKYSDEDFGENNDFRPSDMSDTNNIGSVDDIDDVDKNLMLTFGQEEELGQKIGEAKLNELSDSIEEQGAFFETFGTGLSSNSKLFKEYSSSEQNEAIIGEYGKKHKASIIGFSLVSVILAFVLIIENMAKIGLNPPDIFKPTVYPVVFCMIELQALLLACAAAYKPLLRGLSALIKFKPIPESLAGLVAVLSAVYYIVVAAAFPAYAYGVYSFPLILLIWLLSLQELLNVKREIMSFSVLSIKSGKYALSKLNIENSELEAAAFYEYLPDKPTMYKICKTDFVQNYFRRNSGTYKSKSLMSAVLPISFIITFVFFFVAMFVKNNVGMGLVTAYTAMMFCAPATMLIVFSLPMFKASKDAFTDEGAIVGECAFDEYADASVISFDDKEVFPSYGVKVKSVKIYGNNRIDRVIYNTASVFDSVGGPLSDVFDVATVELGKSKDVVLNDIQIDGIEAFVDGERVCVGKADYISRQGLTPYYDMEDDQYESSGDVSIMYVVSGEKVAAKMYIQYIVDPDFEVLLSQLSRTGVCVGIKTLDPNIDDALLGAEINIQKYPVRIIRCRGAEDMDCIEESVDSGIVSKNSTKGLLKLVATCDKVRNAIKTNTVLSMFSIGVGVAISVFLMLTDTTVGLASFLVGLYHLFWALPIVLASRTLS